VASTIHVLPSGPEDAEGEPGNERPAPEADGEELALSTVPIRAGADRQFASETAGVTRTSSSSRHFQRSHLIVSDGVALISTWVPLGLLASGAGWGRQVLAASAAILATMLALRSVGLYRPHVCALPSRQAARVASATILGAVVFAGCAWLAGTAATSAAVAGACISAALVLALRWRFARWLKAKRSFGQRLRPALLVGTNDDAVAIWEMLREEPELGYLIVGVVGEKRSDAPWRDLPQLTDMADLLKLAARTGADAVIVVAGALPARSISATVNRALQGGLQAQIWPGYLGLSTRRVRFAPVSGLPAFSIEPPGAPTWQIVAKRAIDIVITIAISPVVVPVLIASAIAIKLEDGGSVFYHHSALGRAAQPITVLKLRTMVPNAAQMMADVAVLNERTGGPLFKATNDPRVTRIGRVLRATSIDELPQLWDVLKGTMSLVGPRFSMPHEDAGFDPELRRRYAMRPGLTGLWQSEARDNPAFSAYRRLDLLYVDNWSLGLDLAILANTAHAVGVRAFRAMRRAGSAPATESHGGMYPTLPVTVPELGGVEVVSPE
jgi:exopolysaccharide biosynthesis polyprenyl glycosylphosphotransferase